jgi:dynactin complex subunit
MDGCGDGVWNGDRYFACRSGHGLFCPLSSLKPDERFAPASLTAGNRKMHVIVS